jgi:hypothetical protein
MQRSVVLGTVARRPIIESQTGSHFWDFLFVTKTDLPYRTCTESLVVVPLGVNVE